MSALPRVFTVAALFIAHKAISMKCSLHKTSPVPYIAFLCHIRNSLEMCFRKWLPRMKPCYTQVVHKVYVKMAIPLSL